jgi:hypothetical protein
MQVGRTKSGQMPMQGVAEKNRESANYFLAKIRSSDIVSAILLLKSFYQRVENPDARLWGWVGSGCLSVYDVSFLTWGEDRTETAYILRILVSA